MKKQVRLTEREVAVITLLERFKVLSAEHIGRFLFLDSHTTAASQVEMTRRALRSLLTKGAVKRTQGIEGSTGYAYFLKSAPPKTGMTTIEHQSMLADVALSFELSARRHEGHRVDVFDTSMTFPPILYPDAYMLYCAPDVKLHAFVEVETGSTFSRAFSQKADRYARLHFGSDWERRLRMWPTVLGVCRSVQAIKLLMKATHMSELPPSMEFRFATFEDVQRDPLARIWHVVGREDVHELLS